MTSDSLAIVTHEMGFAKVAASRASDGVIAYIMKLVRYGTYLALNQNQEKLDLNILATAFEKSVRADKPEKSNPFIILIGEKPCYCALEKALTLCATYPKFYFWLIRCS
jgi:tRNA G18 (ribose-2'-O)-methylase SpoU